MDYFIARTIESSTGEWQRRRLLGMSIVMNLGLLFYFKYTNFFLESLGQLLGRLGMEHHMPFLEVILPIGISFYTFEAISYTVDVYHRHAEAEKNPLHFLLFITFFPRMVAGPIIRARNFLPQLKRNKRFSWARFDLGVQYVLMGLFKKMAIADRMSNLVDPVYQSPGQYSSWAVWVAAVAYSLQVYGDFSGYSDIALGTAHMLGFKLPENFNMPYMSRNIAEFWRRWHISLSTWLRDYVFIPMGGSRGTLVRTMFTLMMTFALCGLWHGARWTFVAWGAVQGVMMVAHRLFLGWCKVRPKVREMLETKLGTTLRILATYWACVLSFVIFRSQDFQRMKLMFHAMFHFQEGMEVRYPVSSDSLIFTFVLVAISHLVVEFDLWKKITPRLTPLEWGLAYTVIIILAFMMASESQKTFIYFQF